jgi:hypothetical protein
MREVYVPTNKKVTGNNKTGKNKRSALESMPWKSIFNISFMNNKLRILQSPSDFAKLESDWNRVLAGSSANNFFLTWDWLRTWWQIYSREGDKLFIFVLENDDAVVGIGPCYVRTRKIGGLFPVRRMMFLGTQDSGGGDVGSEYMNLICLDGYERDFVRKMFHAIDRDDICDELYLARMDADSPLFQLIGEESSARRYLSLPFPTWSRPYIKLPVSWDEYLGSLSSAMRYKIRNERRRLLACKNVVFKKAKTQGEALENYRELCGLHQKRWEARGAAGVFANRKFSDFHARIMESMLRQGKLELVVLHENNRGRAAIYNFLYNNKTYFYQSGVDAAPKTPAFGYLLHCYCIEEAIAMGRREYDFLLKGSNDEYKERFANAHRNISFIHSVRSDILKHLVKTTEIARGCYRHFKAMNRALRGSA